MVARQKNSRFQPEFALAIWSANMYVSWLLSFIGIEVKPKRSNSQDSRHENQSITEPRYRYQVSIFSITP